MKTPKSKKSPVPESLSVPFAREPTEIMGKIENQLIIDNFELYADQLGKGMFKKPLEDLSVSELYEIKRELLFSNQKSVDLRLSKKLSESFKEILDFDKINTENDNWIEANKLHRKMIRNKYDKQRQNKESNYFVNLFNPPYGVSPLDYEPEEEYKFFKESTEGNFNWYSSSSDDHQRLQKDFNEYINKMENNLERAGIVVDLRDPETYFKVKKKLFLTDMGLKEFKPK